MLLSETDIRLFWAKVNKNGPNGCWIWMGTLATHTGGYGIFDRRREGVRLARRAHRVAYELLVGPVPEDRMLRHTCDNPPCVNPAHLEPGTAKDNSQDMVTRGRHWTHQRPELIPRGEQHWTQKRGTSSLLRGEDHPGSKLATEQVREIRKKYAEGSTQASLARDFGVSKGLIWQIVKGNYWKDPA